MHERRPGPLERNGRGGVHATEKGTIYEKRIKQTQNDAAAASGP